MEPKKIILWPNPDRDTGMKATKSAIAILRDMGFQTVVCSPFRDPKIDAFGDLPQRYCIKPPTLQEPFVYPPIYWNKQSKWYISDDCP